MPMASIRLTSATSYPVNAGMEQATTFSLARVYQSIEHFAILDFGQSKVVTTQACALAGMTDPKDKGLKVANYPWPNIATLRLVGPDTY